MAVRKAKRWSPLVLLLGALGGCTTGGGPGPATPSPGRPGGPAPARPAAPANAPRFASPAEAEAALVALEDRRAFDPDVLTGAARAADPAIRARAALAVGRLNDDRGRPLLRELLTDPSPEVRAAAAFGCELQADPTLTPGLDALLSDSDPRVAGAAARAVGFLGRGDGQDALLAAIPGAASPELRATMLAALWKSPIPAVLDLAARYASDPDSKIRAAAIYTLSRKPQESSMAILTAALTDAEPDAAAAAARALGVLEKKESLAALGSALEGGRVGVTVNALVAMEAILEKNPGANVPDAVKSRVLALAGDANGDVAVPSLVLLRQFAGADRQVFSRLWSIATTGSGRRRQVALLSAVALLKGKSETALKAAAESPDAALRGTAAEALAYLPAADARPWRERLFADKSALVRQAVLSGIKGAESVRQNRELVHAALTDPDPGVRAAAVDALGELADPSVLPLLREAADKSLADPGADVASAVLGVCEKLRADPGARPIVESLYHQPKTLVSRLARRALLFLFRGDPAALPAPEYKTGKTPADYAAILADAHRPWRAQVETVRGSFTIQLAGEMAPLTVENFVQLAQKKYFDGVAIHRVVPNFVLQDGDPSGTGNGGPGYEIRDEINPLEYGRGTVGMALAGPDTGGSQWFVTHSPQPHLNGIYTVFGQVTAGQDVVERIEQGDTIAHVTVSAEP